MTCNRNYGCKKVNKFKARSIHYFWDFEWKNGEIDRVAVHSECVGEIESFEPNEHGIEKAEKFISDVKSGRIRLNSDGSVKN